MLLLCGTSVNEIDIAGSSSSGGIRSSETVRCDVSEREVLVTVY